MARFTIPPVTRILIGFSVLLTLTHGFLRFQAIPTGTNADMNPAAVKRVSYLTLVPSKILYNPWTLLTSVFVEQNLINFMINTATILFGGRYLERAWGSKGFIRFVAIAAGIPNLLVIPTYVLWGVLTLNTTRANTPISGAITLQAAFLVAFKQLVPEHTVTLYKLKAFSVRVKHFPAIFLLLNTISGIVFGTDTALLLGWYGLVTSWIYLRFFKYQPSLSFDTEAADIRGDASETFAFTTFFPNQIQPFISPIFNQIYLAMCKLGLLKPFSDEAISLGNELAVAREVGALPTTMIDGNTSRPFMRREEAERRRNLALRTLDQRLNSKTTTAPAG